MEKHLEPKVREQTEVKAQDKQEFKRLGSLRRKPGLTLFEWDMEAGEIKPAKMESQVIVGMDRQPKNIHRVIHRQNCVYLQALNLQSATRKVENKIKEALPLLPEEQK